MQRLSRHRAPRFLRRRFQKVGGGLSEALRTGEHPVGSLSIGSAETVSDPEILEEGP